MKLFLALSTSRTIPFDQWQTADIEQEDNSGKNASRPSNNEVHADYNANQTTRMHP